MASIPLISGRGVCKIETRALTTAYEKTGSLPVREPVLVDGGIGLYATDAYAATLKAAAPAATLAGYLRAHLNQIHAGDYFATLAFLPMFPEHEEAIQASGTGEGHQESGDLPGVWPALSSLHRAGLQGGRTPEYFYRSQRNMIPRPMWMFGADLTALACDRAQAAGDLVCWSRADGGLCGFIWESISQRGCRRLAPTSMRRCDRDQGLRDLGLGTRDYLRISAPICLLRATDFFVMAGF